MWNRICSFSKNGYHTRSLSIGLIFQGQSHTISTGKHRDFPHFQNHQKPLKLVSILPIHGDFPSIFPMESSLLRFSRRERWARADRESAAHRDGRLRRQQGAPMQRSPLGWWRTVSQVPGGKPPLRLLCIHLFVHIIYYIYMYMYIYIYIVLMIYCFITCIYVCVCIYIYICIHIII